MSRTIPFTLAVLLAAALVAPGQPGGPAFTAVHGVDAAAYQKWFDRARADGYRVVYVNGYDAGGKAQYAGVAVKEKNPPAWEGRHNLTAAEYQ